MRTDQLRTMYEGWVRDYTTGLYHCALRLTGRTDAADELVQETFYEAWRSIRSLREPDKAKAWLLKILRHRYARWARDRMRGPKTNVAHDSDVWHVETGDPPPVDVLARQESLQAALDELDYRHKVTFLLVFLEGVTCQRAADMLGVPLGTVLSRIHRARQHLRSRLSEGGDAPPLKLQRRPEGRAPGAGTGGFA